MTDDRRVLLRLARRAVWISASARDVNLCGIVKHSDVGDADDPEPCDGELVRAIGLPVFELFDKRYGCEFTSTLHCEKCGDEICDELVGLEHVDLVLAVPHGVAS